MVDYNLTELVECDTNSWNFIAKIGQNHQTLSIFSTALVTSRIAFISWVWQAGEFKVGATTLAQATNWDVARAQCVAAEITWFWITGSLQVAAIFFPFKTNAAVVLAIAFANDKRMSWSSRFWPSSSPIVVRTWSDASPIRDTALSRFCLDCNKNWKKNRKHLMRNSSHFKEGNLKLVACSMYKTTFWNDRHGCSWARLISGMLTYFSSLHLFTQLKIHFHEKSHLQRLRLEIQYFRFLFTLACWHGPDALS